MEFGSWFLYLFGSLLENRGTDEVLKAKLLPFEIGSYIF